jgi:hypothetical protein
MPIRWLFDVLSELREVALSTRLAPLVDDENYPGLFSDYAAGAAYRRWIDGELVLWAAADGGGVEQVGWRPGRFIEWPDSTSDVVITEQRYAGLLPHLMGEGDPPVQRRGNIATSAAGAGRLRAFVQAELKKLPAACSEEEVEQFLRTQGRLSGEDAGERINNEFGIGTVPRAMLRRVHGKLKSEDPAAFEAKRGRPRK